MRKAWQAPFRSAMQQSLRLFMTATFLLVASSLVYLVHLPQSLACSLMDGNADELKQAMAPHIAKAASQILQRNIVAEDIPLNAIAKPSVIFLDGLGSRCEGLDNTIRVASFSFDRKYADGANCSISGVIVMRGFWFNAANVAFHPQVELAVCR